jgi:hypothetical protein
MKRCLAATALCLSAFVSSACGGDDSKKDAVQSTEDAERAYLGLDASIDRAITLGFDGFNAASSANIAPQAASGDASGTMTVTGQVDQGSSSNKTMRLSEALAGYADDPKLVYDTDAAMLPALGMKLAMVPNGTLTGTLVGTFAISGDLQGSVALDLSFTGELEPDPNDATRVERKPGTTQITGTATSGSDTYSVDVTH